jgi:hypothetical protein
VGVFPGVWYTPVWSPMTLSPNQGGRREGGGGALNGGGCVLVGSRFSGLGCNLVFY